VCGVVVLWWILCFGGGYFLCDIVLYLSMHWKMNHRMEVVVIVCLIVSSMLGVVFGTNACFFSKSKQQHKNDSHK